MITRVLDIYTDGSFNGKNASWGFIALERGKEIYRNKGILYGDINSMYQVGGEIKAVENALIWAAAQNCKLNIFFDYTGVELWGTGKWKAKNPHTKAYKEFMAANKHLINSFTKVKSHSNNFHNNEVDKFVKFDKSFP